MENLQNAIQEGALAQMLNDAIASINYKSENDLLNKKTVSLRNNRAGALTATLSVI